MVIHRREGSRLEVRSGQYSAMAEQRLIRLKAELLCAGVRVTDAARHRLGQFDQTFIHGAVFDLGRAGVVNTNVIESNGVLEADHALETVPLLDVADDSFVISSTSGFSHATKIISLGSGADLPLHDGRIGDWFSLHNRSTLFCAPVRQCLYVTLGSGCRFCTFEGGRIRRLPAAQFIEGLSRIQAVRTISDVAIGGGTPLLTDMGAAYFSELAALASERGLGVSVELVPPPSLAALDKLAASGASSIVMSLEVYDEQARSYWCPGKGTVKREYYERAWDRAVKLLGPGKVTSVLLAGSEPAESTLLGVRDLISRGVVPIVIPLRKYVASSFSNWTPVDTGTYLSLQHAVASEMSKAGFSSRAQRGCVACGGCSLEQLLEPLFT